MGLFGWEWLFLDRKRLESATSSSHPVKRRIRKLLLQWHRCMEGDFPVRGRSSSHIDTAWIFKLEYRGGA